MNKGGKSQIKLSSKSGVSNFKNKGETKAISKEYP
jgi:hypothetical protein